ncbi:MAG: NIPSNAP family protein [Chloroflexi bacterium]|nr:NIPSNAP family protein [Chloroflexota bacterium]
MTRVIEIRSLNLKPGARAAFHDLYVRESVPLLNRWNFDVVAYGPSLHDDDSYYVIRSFANIEERQQLEDVFYGSDDWRKGPREALLGMIDSYTDTVFEVDEIVLRGLRRQ